jgi:hypothetical protein
MIAAAIPHRTSPRLQFGLRAAPVAVTVMFVLFCAAIASVVRFGSTPHWAFIVLFAPVPVALLLHIVLIVVERRRLIFVGYALVHLALLGVLWYYLFVHALLHITGDTL